MNNCFFDTIYILFDIPFIYYIFLQHYVSVEITYNLTAMNNILLKFMPYISFNLYIFLQRKKNRIRFLCVSTCQIEHNMIEKKNIRF